MLSLKKSNSEVLRMKALFKKIKGYFVVTKRGFNFAEDRSFPIHVAYRVPLWIFLSIRIPYFNMKVRFYGGFRVIGKKWKFDFAWAVEQRVLSNKQIKILWAGNI